MSILGSLFGTRKSGKCKTIKIKKSGCTQQLCHTGKGVTGWTFVAGTRRCPTGGRGTNGLAGTRKRRKTRKKTRRSRRGRR